MFETKTYQALLRMFSESDPVASPKPVAAPEPADGPQMEIASEPVAGLEPVAAAAALEPVAAAAALEPMAALAQEPVAALDPVKTEPGDNAQVEEPAVAPPAADEEVDAVVASSTATQTAVAAAPATGASRASPLPTKASPPKKKTPQQAYDDKIRKAKRKLHVAEQAYEADIARALKEFDAAKAKQAEKDRDKQLRDEVKRKKEEDKTKADEVIKSLLPLVNDIVAQLDASKTKMTAKDAGLPEVTALRASIDGIVARFKKPRVMSEDAAASEPDCDQTSSA